MTATPLAPAARVEIGGVEGKAGPKRTGIRLAPGTMRSLGPTITRPTLRIAEASGDFS